MLLKLQKATFHMLLVCYFCFIVISCEAQDKSSSNFNISISQDANILQIQNISQENTNNSCDFSEYNTLYQKPDAVIMARPLYPKKAKRKKIYGDVKVRILVDKTGKILRACAVEGNELLRSSATKAALKWKCSPPLKDLERANKDYLEYVITFNFRP
jgi:TonB family protein